MVLQLWDTAGQEGYEHIRVLSYENTSCFIVCFNVVEEVTFKNISVWLDELRSRAPSAKILLVKKVKVNYGLLFDNNTGLFCINFTY